MSGHPRWSDSIGPPAAQAGGRSVIGVLEGEGCGPELIQAALRVLDAVSAALGRSFEIRRGGPIGKVAEAECGQALPPETVAFCRDVFADGGAILSGPGGGRFVYDLRRALDLFCKISPLQPWPELRGAGRLKPEAVDGIDCLFVRDNAGGVYQGAWSLTEDGERHAHHSFSYSEHDVRRILVVASRLAARRRGRLTVIQKAGGIPSVSALWRSIAHEVCGAEIAVDFADVDYASYLIVQDPQRLDVVVAPNLLGDILIDLSAVLLGSRGLGYSGNFTPDCRGVYQTNHGAAYDLAGTGLANPAAQIFSVAMLLHESFGFEEGATLIRKSVREVWRRGWRTGDLREPGCLVVGANEFAEGVADAVRRLAAETVGP